MNRECKSIIVALVLLGAIPAVMAQSLHNVYLHGELGWGQLRTSDGFSLADGLIDPDRRTSFDGGLGYSVAVGMTGEFLRLELEYKGLRNDIEAGEAAASTGSEDIRSSAVLLNAWVPLRRDGRLRPVVGGGIGFMRVKLDNVGTESDVAIQGGVGAEWHFTPQFVASGTIRYFSADRLEFDLGSARAASLKYEGFSTGLGLRYQF